MNKELKHVVTLGQSSVFGGGASSIMHSSRVYDLKKKTLQIRAFQWHVICNTKIDGRNHLGDCAHVLMQDVKHNFNCTSRCDIFGCPILNSFLGL